MHIKLSVVTWILCVTLVTLEKRPKFPIHHKLGSSLQELQNVCADRVYVKYMSKTIGGEIKRPKSFFFYLHCFGNLPVNRFRLAEHPYNR